MTAHAPPPPCSYRHVASRVVGDACNQAFHFHITDVKLGRLLPLEAGDDAGAVMWLDIDSADYKWQNLYASHKEIVQKAARRLVRTTSTIDDED